MAYYRDARTRKERKNERKKTRKERKNERKKRRYEQDQVMKVGQHYYSTPLYQRMRAFGALNGV